MSDIKYIHERNDSFIDGIGWVKDACGGVTIAYREEADNKLAVAVAICNQTDNYNKAIGRKTASERLEAKDERFSAVVNNEGESAEFSVSGEAIRTAYEVILPKVFDVKYHNRTPKDDEVEAMEEFDPIEYIIPEDLEMYDGVIFTNLTFGNKPMDLIDWNRLRNQSKLIEEELAETIEAIKNKDFKEMRDGISDILVTTLGLAHLVAIDADADMKAVLLSNLSKVSKTQADAALTQQYYKETVGLTTRLEECPTLEGGYIVKVQGEQVGKDGKTYPDGKFLKCRVSFRAPQFN